MKYLAMLMTIVSSGAAAAVPSNDVIHTCAATHAVTRSVSIKDIQSQDISSEDDYQDGYNATFFFHYQSKDIGYAEKGKDVAIIGFSKLYPISTAQTLREGAKPSEFTPFQADWSMVKEGDESYLCVSFNFDGIGHSGSFQNVRGGYLLNTSKKKSDNNFFYFVYDLRSK